MMNFMVGERVGDEYVPMMQEELALDGNDSRAPRWTREVPAATREKFHVLVIGAGMSGLLQALRLKEAGIPFTVVEKNDSVGGTWYENQYPGLPRRHRQPLLLLLVRAIPVDRVLLAPRRAARVLPALRQAPRPCRTYIRYNTEVTAAKYDEKHAVWDVELKSNTGGAPRKMRVNALVSAVGQLNRPRIPEIEGREKFSGVQLHSAEWDPELDLTGKRVAVIGSGASAFQLVPEVAKLAARAVRVPALGAVDAAEPALPRPVSTPVPLAGAARALLRALVPLPHLLPGQRRDPAGDPHRQELPAPGARGERAERPVPRAASSST